MILITGAAGKTGLAVLEALKRRNLPVRVLVRRADQADFLMKTGAVDAVIGDMTAGDSYSKALSGIDCLYHICPNMHPSEFSIGEMIIESACRAGLSHFIYHSVLHPQTEKMPHHWQKMRVEEKLFESGLNFTVMQPAPYMQNILTGKSLIADQQVYRVPYPKKTKISLLDLEDLAEAVAVIANSAEHFGAIYEIVGTGALSQDHVAGVIGRASGQDISAAELEIGEWRKQAEKNGLGTYQIATLVKMFEYYASFGLAGNKNVLRWLLGREPNSLSDFAKREFAGVSSNWHARNLGAEEEG